MCDYNELVRINWFLDPLGVLHVHLHVHAMCGPIPQMIMHGTWKMANGQIFSLEFSLRSLSRDSLCFVGYHGSVTGDSCLPSPDVPNVWPSDLSPLSRSFWGAFISM